MSGPRQIATAVALVAACGGARPTPVTQPGPGAAASAPEEPPHAPPATAAPAFEPETAPPPGVGAAPGSGRAAPVPVIVEQVADNGRWILACQALADTNGDGRLDVEAAPDGALVGDALERQLLVGGTGALPVDELWGASSDGRWVAYADGAGVWLHDLTTGERLDLIAEGVAREDDAAEPHRHRAVDFSADSSEFAYYSAARHRVVVRTLATLATVELDPGPGVLWRLRYVAPGTVAAWMTAPGSGGRDRWPLATRRGVVPCRTPSRMVAAAPATSDGVEARLLLRGGARRSVPGFVALLGDRALFRDGGGRLLLEAPRGGGRAAEVADDDCAGRLVAVAPRRGAALIGCQTKGFRLAARLVTTSGAVELALELPPASRDVTVESDTRYLPVHAGAAAHLVDLERERTLPLPEGARVLAVSDGGALLLDDAELLLWTPERVERLRGDVTLGASTRTAGATAWVSPCVVQLDERGRTAGWCARAGVEPLWLAPAGQLLIAAEGPDDHGIARGPLSWLQAVSPDGGAGAGPAPSGAGPPVPPARQTRSAALSPDQSSATEP